MPLKIAAVVLFAAACLSLYFGVGWLFLMPRFPGESYFTVERIVYGVGSMLLTVALLVSVGWAWTRSGVGLTVGKAISNSFGWAMAAVALFWLLLMVMGVFASNRVGLLRGSARTVRLGWQLGWRHI
jgi:hypothetical protein